MGVPSDTIEPLPDGSIEKIWYRRSPRLTPAQAGHHSRMRKIIDPDGQTREIWHEVIDSTGMISHQHLKYQRGAPDVGAR